MQSIKLFGDWAPKQRQTLINCFKDINLINLEGSVIKNIKEKKYLPAKKVGPLILNRNLPETNNKIFFNLANNHIFDYGLEGLIATKNELDNKNYGYAGAGISEKESKEPFIFEFNNKKICILSRCETQFGSSDYEKSGVAILDNKIFNQIGKLKEIFDFIIVSIHCGAEMSPWPSPTRQDNFRALVDAGATIVHGHHSHIPQGWEKYNNGFIFYGLGNFCVDPMDWGWHPNGLWSLAPEFNLSEGNLQLKINTTVQEKKNEDNIIIVRDSMDAEIKDHINYIKDCNYPLQNPILLKGLWQEISIRMYKKHFSKWLNFDASLIRSNYRICKNLLLSLKDNFFSKKKNYNFQKQNLLRFHLFACESHKDVIETSLGLISGETKDYRSLETVKLVDKWFIDE